MNLDLFMKFEKLGLKIEELSSLILMCEQAIYNGNFSHKNYEMGLSHVVVYADDIKNEFNNFLKEVEIIKK